MHFGTEVNASDFGVKRLCVQGHIVITLLHLICSSILQAKDAQVRDLCGVLSLHGVTGKIASSLNENRKFQHRPQLLL